MEKNVLFCSLIIFIWVVFGNPSETIASLFWPESAAPWEKVNAFYYPNNDRPEERYLDIGSIEECRDWVFEQAAKNGDQSMTIGDYECGVSCELKSSDLYSCRITVE